MKIAKKNFLGLEKNFSDFEKSKVVIVPFGFERSTSYIKGTKFGPEAIIKASWQVELFDEEFEKEIFREIGIATLKIKRKKRVKEALNQLSEIVFHLYELNKLPIILGGEHTLTIGSLTATIKKYKNLTLLQFDAHADLRDSYQNDKYSHGSVMRRCLEISENFNLVQIGIRNISNEEKDGKEYEFLKNNQKRIKTFWAREMDFWQIEEIIKNLNENIYLTFDLDVFDPAIMPSVGTPEPGGLSWYQVLKILKEICQKRKIVGADFVEFCPIKNFSAPDFLVAKLIYKFISYLYAYERRT
jgi:agmatinase